MAEGISAGAAETGGLIYQGTYAEYKSALDTEIRKTAEGFVRVGYLLKIARDTSILHESGYGSVAEFAQAEYGLTKDVVSRYIAINDKYSEGGYGDRLQERFRGYGVAKLAEMLTLPDSVIEAMNPQLTKAQIREVKEEVKAELEITPVEVMLEQQEENQLDKSLLQMFLYQYFRDQADKFVRIHPFTVAGDITEDRKWIENALDVLCPAGNGCESVRVPGKGRLMLFFKGREQDMDLVDIRADERQQIPWNRLREEILRMCCRHEIPKKAWESVYGETFPEETSEPVKEEPKKEESKKEEPKETTAPEEKKKQEPKTDKSPIEKLKKIIRDVSGKEKVAPAQQEKAHDEPAKQIEDIEEPIMNPPEVIPEEETEIVGSFWEKRMEIKEGIKVLQEQFLKADWDGMAETADMIRKKAESMKEI